MKFAVGIGRANRWTACVAGCCAEPPNAEYPPPIAIMATAPTITRPVDNVQALRLIRHQMPFFNLAFLLYC